MTDTYRLCKSHKCTGTPSSVLDLWKSYDDANVASDRTDVTTELRLSPLALGISWRFLAGRTPREKARSLRRAAVTLLKIADEFDGRRS